MTRSEWRSWRPASRRSLIAYSMAPKMSDDEEGEDRAGADQALAEGVAHAAEHLLDERREPDGAERLGEVVIGAGEVHRLAVGGLRARRQHDHRRRGGGRIRAQLAEHVAPAAAGHHHVEQDQVGVLGCACARVPRRRRRPRRRCSCPGRAWRGRACAGPARRRTRARSGRAPGVGGGCAISLASAHEFAKREVRPAGRRPVYAVPDGPIASSTAAKRWGASAP